MKHRSLKFILVATNTIETLLETRIRNRLANCPNDDCSGRAPSGSYHYSSHSALRVRPPNRCSNCSNFELSKLDSKLKSPVHWRYPHCQWRKCPGHTYGKRHSPLVDYPEDWKHSVALNQDSKIECIRNRRFRIFLLILEHKLATGECRSNVCTSLQPCRKYGSKLCGSILWIADLCITLWICRMQRN